MERDKNVKFLYDLILINGYRFIGTTKFQTLGPFYGAEHLVYMKKANGERSYICNRFVYSYVNLGFFKRLYGRIDWFWKEFWG